MLVSIRVITKAKQQKVVEEPGRLKVYLNAPPVDGKANEALIELLAEYFKIKKNKMRIVKGLKSKDKVVEMNF
ncbi:hypothetical protein A2276_02810 [candidate division WOR-1 bacterium RIFOXYA12_FULL_43_27]|uniref:UPF0235 protein A2438_01525 n=1 Tax=candidate division WOR-1 bacterium RIFOXYC2_FULL_46_14 TaxID=1802587 RepID=A0A1F4U7Q6_UNCSA|nr:MAG: hypothetical protein A2276_02810 [candidate division WOR-1 bacterium RIFOXYA12_FULL_43_27]OGC19361.1 MAG: hypothetical protein A2292_01525 [candidate division WOR-1 bacterium RIFOXYB2_FULL_46_45]OGC30350.1 MAG: hypothetical protein A2232_01525 [candidate division WOR-1 bacterium RIFOXYA2_FULL_46_56]OGC40951.1 MAG: hypothetical protein A2438_01525 [candidate division WOR-1 bacterium RIFOXYC2_FULL_46_14]